MLAALVALPANIEVVLSVANDLTSHVRKSEESEAAAGIREHAAEIHKLGIDRHGRVAGVLDVGSGDVDGNTSVGLHVRNFVDVVADASDDGAGDLLSLREGHHTSVLVIFGFNSRILFIVAMVRIKLMKVMMIRVESLLLVLLLKHSVAASGSGFAAKRRNVKN